MSLFEFCGVAGLLWASWQFGYHRGHRDGVNQTRWVLRDIRSRLGNLS